jgi:dTDP-4-dehydrorhamnose 3,5-epimerase
MIFHPTRLSSIWLVEIEPHRDQRGHFARTWCRREFAAYGLETEFVQASLSFNHARGTIRGMHFQKPPLKEVKLVRCTRGAIFDVVVDLRSGSATQRLWQGFELSAGNAKALYIPDGFAHGFQTLEPDTEVAYQVSEYYVPDAASGVRFDDPAFAIEWPLPATEISPRDRTWPDFATPAGGAGDGSRRGS